MPMPVMTTLLFCMSCVVPVLLKLLQKRNQGEHFCPPLNTVILCSGSGLLGCNQLVDFCAEVLENEILLGRNLAFVHFLGPLLKRNLDAESLVDSEDDVEEVEAVDAQIVDGVAIRRDGVTVDFTAFGDDVADFVKSRGQVSILLFMAVPQMARI